jgi:uncharacterized protein YdcH (DUF465 family)
MLMLKK